MDRRNFLAIIPSLSAIPFIGKDIVKKSDRIEIYQPEEVNDYTKQLSNTDTYLAVVRNGKVIGTAYMTSIDISNNQIDVSCRDNGGARTMINGAISAQIQAELIGPVTTDMLEGLHETFRYQRPYIL